MRICKYGDQELNGFRYNDKLYRPSYLKTKKDRSTGGL